MDHSVNVLQFAEARASEIASLMNQVNSSEKSKKKTWFQNLPHHMRRRGASQNPKRVPKNLRGSNQSSTSKPTTKGKKHKKKPKDLKAEYAKRSKPDNTWLENHIWFAKRFKMKNLWGYQLPLHSNDRKQGSSCAAAANRAMLQDLSYYCCIELTGVQEKLLSHLSTLADASAGHTFASEMFLDGSKEGYSFLYHPESCPYKAIGPVSFIWKPVLDEKTQEYKSDISGESKRKLWVWCHPSIHDELVQVLVNIFDFQGTKNPKEDIAGGNEMENDDNESKAEPVHQFTFSCKLNYTKTEKHFCKEKTYISSDINMVLRKNTLVRHRLIGPMSQSILTQVLRLADVTESSDSSQVKESSCENSAKKFKADITDVKGNDPLLSQLWWKSYFESDNRKQAHASKGEALRYLMDPQSSYYITPRSVLGLTVRDPRIEPGWRQENEKDSEEEEFSDDLSKIDEFLTPEFADSALWEDNIRNEVTATKLSDQEINNERSKCIGTVELGDKESRIPIIIIHQSGLNGFGAGWDIIAPLGWSLEFWRSFERKGGRPAGLRDLHVVNLESGRPNFPCSFPDTEAGATYEEKIRTEDLTQFYRHPRSKRPNFTSLGIRTPFFMCWKTLIKDWKKELENPEIKVLFPPVEDLNAKDYNKSEKTNDCHREYYVLRQKDLRQLGNLCSRLNKTPRRGISEETKVKLSDDFSSFVISVQPKLQFNESLIVLKIHCMNKGRPSMHSGLYLLSDADVEEVKNNPQFCGPSEPCHPCAKKHQEGKKNLERPQIDSLISASSRKMIGYVSEGGFSRVSGQGYAIGHCTSVGFLVMWKQCLEAQLRPLILVREQHCFKYRVGTVDIIENYL